MTKINTAAIRTLVLSAVMMVITTIALGPMAALYPPSSFHLPLLWPLFALDSPRQTAPETSVISVSVMTLTAPAAAPPRCPLQSSCVCSFR